MQVAIIAGAGNGIGPILAVAGGPTEVLLVQVTKVKVKVMSKPENLTPARPASTGRKRPLLPWMPYSSLLSGENHV